MFGQTSHLASFGHSYDQSKQMDKLDPMQNQLCRVCDEPAAGFHFGAFTCEGCKSFFGRTSNNQSVIQECKNNYRCIINKKNRTACKACRLRKCLLVGMSKSGSRYGRRSNWFKIHCLMQQAASQRPTESQPVSYGSHLSPLPKSCGSDSPVNTSLESAGKTEVKARPKASLWRPQVTPEKEKPKEELFNLPKSSKANDFPSLGGISSQEHESSPSRMPDLSQLFSLYGSYNLQQTTTDKEKPANQISPIAAAALAAMNASMVARFPALYSLAGASPLAFLPPTFNNPALSALPLHKQMLLSPLLASSHLWASVNRDNNDRDAEGKNLFEEHRDLLSKFRPISIPDLRAFKSPMTSDADVALISDEESDSPVDETMPHLSDTEEEEEEIGEKEGSKKNESPLDLTFP